MKALSMILAMLLLAGCASVRDTSGASGTEASGMSGSGTVEQMEFNRINKPGDTYFGD